jgi:hypothetical protein
MLETFKVIMDNDNIKIVENENDLIGISEDLIIDIPDYFKYLFEDLDRNLKNKAGEL